MKFQWNLILALLFALVVAIFAVINVDPVNVNYLFGTAKWPLILIILGSVLMGGIIVGSVGLVRVYVLQRQVKQLQRQHEQLQKEHEQLQHEHEQLQHERTSGLEEPAEEELIKIEQKQEE